MLAGSGNEEIEYYRVADRSDRLPFGKRAVLLARDVTHLRMVLCASAAATRSLQSEERSSVPMKCVAFLKTVE